MNKRLIQSKNYKFLILIPLILGCIFLVNLLGSPFLTVTINGHSTIVSSFSPSDGKISPIGSAVTIGAKTQISIGDSPASLSTWKIEIAPDGGSWETLSSKSWSESAGITLQSYTTSRILPEGKYYLRLTLTVYGSVEGSSASGTPLTSVFYIANPPSVSITSPTEGETIRLSASEQWAFTKVPIELIVTQGTSAVAKVTAHVDSHTDRKWESSGTGTFTEDIQIQATAYADGTTTDHSLIVSATDTDGVSRSKSINFKVLWLYTGSEEDDDIPGFEFPLLLTTLIAIYLFRKRRQKKSRDE